MIKYLVKIGYEIFAFENACEAMAFAETAKLSYGGKEYRDGDSDISVTIELVSVENTEDEDEPDISLDEVKEINVNGVNIKFKEDK